MMSIIKIKVKHIKVLLRLEKINCLPKISTKFFLYFLISEVIMSLYMMKKLKIGVRKNVRERIF